jgi:hypothetical protein
MPSQHQLPAGNYRAGAPSRKPLAAAAEQLDSGFSTHINTLPIWLVGGTDGSVRGPDDRPARNASAQAPARLAARRIETAA